ncbi:thioredoxin domain-containing protein [Candidatus Woesearchaeota archaeon]|nr:thioredoxin domain-containing protein [Candidatus Woesearchaeota archaeon]
MICIIALIIFGVLGIFSARHRIIAKEALDCVLRRITLRKCETGLDKRLKAQITGRLMKGYPRTGRQVYKHFELISWFFTILLVLSIIFSAQGLYFFAKYGNCNGLNSDKFCIFDPLNSLGGDDFSSEVCIDPSLVSEKELSFAGSIEGHPSIGSKDAAVTVIEFGCFSCPNTAIVEPVVRNILEEFTDKILFVYVDFPLKHHDYAYEASLAAECIWNNQPELYWDYHINIFENQATLSQEVFLTIASEVGADIESLNKCLANEESKSHVDEDFQSGIDSNVYGTPTFFVNEESLVGAVSYKELKKLIEDQLKE